MELEDILTETICPTLGYKFADDEKIAGSVVTDDRVFLITNRGTAFGWDVSSCWYFPLIRGLSPRRAVKIWNSFGWRDIIEDKKRWGNLMRALRDEIQECAETDLFAVTVTLMLTVFLAASVIVSSGEQVW